MMAPLATPSVFSIRRALEQIDGAVRLEPSPEDAAAGVDPGAPILGINKNGSESAGRADALGFEDDGEAVAEQPTLVFEVPSKLTDADVKNVLGEGFGELARLVQLKSGTDALGWYVTFHQRAAQHGVHIPIEGVAQLAISALGGLTLPLERRLEIAFHAILRHELFHFEADCMAANWELSTGRVVYWAAKECRDLPGYKDLEEALANAYMLRGFRHPGGALRNSRGSYDALSAFCALQLPGYREGPRYAKSKTQYISGCRILSANFEEALKEQDDWDIPRPAFDTLILYPDPFRIDWQRCPILVYDRLSLLRSLGIAADLFETIAGIVESRSFLHALSKAGQGMFRLWERRKGDLARSVSLNSLGFERWPPGGLDCYSVRLDGNFRAHLRRVRTDGTWIAESIGDHKSMGHG